MLNFKDYIREIADFPKPGISYKDITPLLLEPKIVSLCVEAICDNLPHQKQIHKVVGIESRGFLLSTLIAQKLNAGVVLVRKPGKLPYKTHKKSYSLEYGEDSIEMHVDAIRKGENVLIHDDVLATGGTAKATNDLVEMSGGIVIQNNFLIELEALKGRHQLLNQDIFSLITY
ncbi:adenine phosphoribosyltransferase [Mesohalobacter salilacus]|uniref:adenine phosphoribosyltransferase n=1 Tax=Mesohalobacter salilacus TaxID=2491711 RepID=UPI0026A0D640